MRLIWYEWKKLWKNASVLKTFLFFFILSGIVFWSDLGKNEEWLSEYLHMHSILEEKGGDASAWLDEKIETQSTADYEEWVALEQISREAKAIDGYEAYRASIQNQYEKNQEISIFSDSEWNQTDYMRRIAETYKELRITAPMQLQPYLGVEHLLDFYAGDLLAVIFLIYLVSVVFCQEEKTGKTDFACTMYYGKTRLFLAKLFVVYISFTAYILFAFFLNFVLEEAFVGPVSFSAAIQSVPQYFAVPYAWTIGKYIFVCIVLKVFAAAILTAAAVVFARRFHSVILMAAGITGILGFSIWAGSFFGGGGLTAAVRIWNVWSFLRGKPVIGTYELIRFGNFMIESVWGFLPLLVLTIGMIMIAGTGSRRERKRKIKIKKGTNKKPHTLFYYEVKKIWIYQRGIFFFAACILLQGLTVRQYRDYLGTEEYYYQQYIDRFGDRITKQTAADIAAEEDYFSNIERELMQEENVYRADALQKELERRMGLDKYVNRMEALKNDEKEGIFLKDVQYSILFCFTEVSRMMVLLLCVSFAFLIPAVFQKEKETHAEVLQRTSVCGGAKLWNAKIAALHLYTIPLIAVFGIISFVRAVSEYDLKLLAPADCLPQYWSSDIKLPVIVFFVTGIIVQCVSASAVLILLSAFGKRVKNQYMLTGMILGGAVVPTLLSPYLSARWLRMIHDFFFVFTYQSQWMMAGLLFIFAAAAAITGKEILCREKNMTGS